MAKARASAAAATATYKVSGRVFNANGEPIMGQEVLITDVDLVGAAIYNTGATVAELKGNGGFEFLSVKTINTDIDGYYELSFSTADYQKNEIGLADVVVFAVDDGKIMARSKLATNSDYINDNEIQHLDIQLADAAKRGTSEYTRLIAVIQPFVQQNKLQLFQLSGSIDQVNFVAEETGQDSWNTALAVQAAQLCNDYQQYKFSAELFYGIGRQNITLSWTALLLQSATALMTAIQQSIDQNIIVPQDGKMPDAFIKNIKTASLDDSASAPETADFYKTIGFTVKDANLQKAIAQSYVQFSNSPADFWNDLANNKGVTADTIKSLQLTNQLSLLTGQHTPLIEQLQVTKGIKDPSDMLRLNSDDWNNLIKTTGVPASVIGDTPEEKASTYINTMQNVLNAAYPTKKIALMVNSGQLFFADAKMKEKVAAFFTTAEKFDISKDRITDFENDIKKVAGTTHDQLLQSLQLMQRIYQLSPTPDAMDTLIRKGYRSARQISSIPQNTFIGREAKDLQGEDTARSVYNRARHLVMRSQLAALRLRDTMDKATPSKIISGDQQTAIKKYIDSISPTTLASSSNTPLLPVQDCECNDCSSIFSPASYFVDIMQYLDNCKPMDGESPLAVLFERRPDIGNLLLTCPNTNTEIPYIDLVNEIMEYYVAHSKDNTIAFTPGDTGNAAASQLRAEPQYTIIDAYWVIYQNAVYPFNLPYHQPLDVMRRYLDFLKSSRTELLEIFPFYKNASNNNTPVTSNMKDAERLSLSLKEYQILTNVNFSGTDAGNSPAQVYFGSPAPVYADGSIQVLDLLQRMGLDYTDLIKMLETRFINPGQNAYNVLQALIAGRSVTPQVFYNELKNNSWNSNTSETYLDILQPNNITLAAFGSWLNNSSNGSTNFTNFQQLITLYETSPDPCNLGATVLKSVQMIYDGTGIAIESFLSNLHRFVRLWRKTGWNIHELDAMIDAVGNHVIDKDFIHNIGIVEKIKSLLQLPLLQLAAIWGSIDTTGNDSLYAQLFLKNTGYTTANGIVQQDIFVSNPLNEILPQNPALSSSDLAAVYAAFSISAEEYNAISTDANITAIASLENLGVIYRYKLLSDALQLSIADFCILKSASCFNINPFDNPDDTLTFIRKVQNLQSSGVSVTMINYILSGRTDTSGNTTLSQDTILAALPDLRNKFLAIDNGTADSDTKKQTEQALILSVIDTLTGLGIPAQFIPDAIMNALMTALPGAGLTGNYFSDTDFETSVAIQTDPTIDFSWGNATPASTIPADGFSVRWQGWICPPADGDYTLTIQVSEIDESARLWVGRSKIIDKAPGAAIVSSGKISLRGGKFYPVIIEYVENTGNAGIQFLWQADNMPQAIVDTTFLYTDSLVQAFLQNIILCHRPAQFISSFQLTGDEVNYLLNNKQDFDNFNLFALTNVHWQRITNYSALRKTIRASSLPALFQMAVTEFQAGAPDLPSDNLITAIVNATGWNKDYLSYLAGNAGFPQSSPPVPGIQSFYGFTVSDLKNEIAFLQIKKALDLAKRTNMPVNDSGLPSWVQVEEDITTQDDFTALHITAEQIKNAVKSRYSDNWLTIARQLNDTIRENQKQALISYMLNLNLSVNGNTVTDADSLYEYLLIDVQMSAVVVTSRLIQATMAVQLFADRCLLGLEKDKVSPDAIDPDEWDWMKHYSIAAGLKKLFVYVENYLDPSLRDDKSPFFEELESNLKKSDITDENVENAFRDYLHKLNEVSNMEMCGMYSDEETKTLHVFARTHSAPYNYYYRTQDSYGHWSAWEQVQLDIKSTDDGDNSGVHLMPVIWKKRLFLFWPEFMQKPLKANPGNSTLKGISETPGQPADPKKYWEIRLAWSEYANGKWTPKKVSKEVLSPMLTENKQLTGNQLAIIPKLTSATPSDYFFTSAIGEINQLIITLYISHFSNRTRFRQNESVFVSNFTLTDIHEKISVSPDIYMPAYESSYIHFYQSSREKSPLIIGDIDFLQNETDHKVLFSNQIAFTNFINNVRYPFFYTDSIAQRTYFVSPYDLSIFQHPGNLVNGIAAPLALTDTNKLNQAPISGGMVSSMKMEMMTGAPSSTVATSLVKMPPAINKIVITPAVLLNGTRQYAQPVQMQPAPFNGSGIHNLLNNPKLAFYTFYHPFAAIFIKKLNEGGVKKLLEADTAEYPDAINGVIDDGPTRLANDNGTAFANYDADFTRVKKYDPVNPDPERNYYLENVDFSEYGAYAIYNWELFFHAPFLIATRLSNNGKYAEARKWFHYIFNPISNDGAGANNLSVSYWQVLPFKKHLSDITELFSNLMPGYDTDIDNPANADNAKIDQWRADPFNAFLIARNRPISFMKNVVMSYLDNLIAWGDDLFRSYTRENINEATQLYVMAAQILGPVPQYVPARGTVQSSSYNALKPFLNDFGDAAMPFENGFPSSGNITITDTSIPQGLLGIGSTLYFCVPPNDHLLQYWTKVGDRLFKIRHGENIDGIVKPLALYEPPIDPALLLKAKGQGMDIGSIIADIESPAPLYRFVYLLQKAKEFCGEVVSMGNALLSASEKQDAEALSRMRQTQEIAMLQMVKDVKTRQVLEAQGNLDALNTNRETSIQKLEYYAAQLLGNPETVVPDVADLSGDLTDDSSLPSETIITPVTSSIDVSLSPAAVTGVRIIPEEKMEIEAASEAILQLIGANVAENLASIYHLMPDFDLMTAPLGTGGTLKIPAGTAFGDAYAAIARHAQGQSSFYSAGAGNAARMAGYIRREQEWVFQANMTIREIVQLDKQITVAQIRLQMAQHELDNHNRQIQNSQEIEQFLETKFSNQELYQWMMDKLQDVHKQGYQLAYDMARTAEKAYRFELGLEDSNFIQYGYYQDAYIGITAGEQLQLALNQMDSAYIENNLREFEITKHISLTLVDPVSLLKLKETGACTINLPEGLFDLDFPIHYFRRVKSMSISIPCVAGPYTSVNATLRLTSSRYRISSDTTNGYAEKSSGETRFRTINSNVTAIATSNAQNDSGVFELNFRDERYLPFEGAGAISTWSLELMEAPALRQFDYETISDVILHLKYTAREDITLKDPVTTNLPLIIGVPGGILSSILFDVKHEFTDAWYAFTNATGTTDPVNLALDISKDRLPFFAANKNVQVSNVTVYAKKKDISDTTALPFNTGQSLTLDTATGLYTSNIASTSNITDANDFVFSISMTKDNIEKTNAIFIALTYRLS